MQHLAEADKALRAHVASLRARGVPATHIATHLNVVMTDLQRDVLDDEPAEQNDTPAATGAWRKIPSFDSRYEINRSGDIRSYAGKGHGVPTLSQPHALKKMRNGGYIIGGKWHSARKLTALTFGSNS